MAEPTNDTMKPLHLQLLVERFEASELIGSIWRRIEFDRFFPAATPHEPLDYQRRLTELGAGGDLTANPILAVAIALADLFRALDAWKSQLRTQSLRLFPTDLEGGETNGGR